MAKLTVVQISKAGIADMSASLVAADAAGDSIDASSGVLIAFVNGSGTTKTATVTAPVSSTNAPGLGALAVSDLTLAIGAGDTGFLAIPQGYIDGSGEMSWTLDDDTSVTVGAFSIAP